MSESAREWDAIMTIVVAPVTSPQEVRTRLSRHRDLLHRYGVDSVAVFGSVARGEASQYSDVDLLVNFDRPVGVFSVMRLERELTRILGRQVEIVTEAALKPRLRERIVREAVDAA